MYQFFRHTIDFNVVYLSCPNTNSKPANELMVRLAIAALFFTTTAVAPFSALAHTQTQACPPPGDTCAIAPRSPHTLFLPEVRGPAAFAFQPSFRISVNPTAHADYGLAYPVTYRFTLPPGSSDLSVYRRTTPDGPWTFVPKKTTADFFNGIEAVRFDYAAHRAFVSVAFGAESDDIYLAFVDSSGVRVPAEFERIAWYYDARAAAVVVTGDDESDWAHEQFLLAYQAFTAAHIWFTSAINTGVLNNSGLGGRPNLHRSGIRRAGLPLTDPPAAPLPRLQLRNRRLRR